MNLSLFSTQPAIAGFRLLTYEIYNWGTFDGVVWSITPDGETSLLTGANASGKTTLVDGLLTLLVPEKRNRAYNQTAGAKGERTEESYVLGEYGETETEDNIKEIKRLRPGKDTAHSILLAVFKNEERFVTLVQCRWFSSGELKRIFILAHKKLSITQDFTPFDFNGDWRKRLKQKYPATGGKDILWIGDAPGEYGRQMRKIFGMRSPKAHTLFSQTLGLKVLGNLDDFVRNQMLEESDTESEFKKIKEHFKTLYDAHTAIEKAYEQINLLKPIREKAIEITDIKLKLKNLDDSKSALPYFFSNKHIQLIESYCSERKAELDRGLAEAGMIKYDLDQANDKERALDIQIRQDETGNQISQLQKENKELEIDRKEREDELQRYNRLASSLNLAESDGSEKSFEAQRLSAQKNKSEIYEKLESITNEIRTATNKNVKNAEEFSAVFNELEELKSQKNNITGRVAEIRKELLKYTGASEKEIPFIGELIQVKAEERNWEYAIEKLLRSFALRIIVPEKYYEPVNEYVNKNDLKGRIVYERYNERNSLNEMMRSDHNDVFTKLNFQTSKYTNWVESEIHKQYNFICTDDLTHFRQLEKALTSEGLIKNKTRHEKDDRIEKKDRRQYVLGWDNKEKIELLREHCHRLEAVGKNLTEQVNGLERQQKRLKSQDEDLTRFLEFKQFKKIDWWIKAKCIQKNNDNINALQKSNSPLLILTKQREQLLKDIQIYTGLLDQRKVNNVEIERDLQQKELTANKRRDTISIFSSLDFDLKVSQFEAARLKDIPINIFNIEGIERTEQSKLNKEISEGEEKLRDAKSAAETFMRQFKHPDDESLLQRFPDWKNDVFRLSVHADFIDEYVQYLDNVEKQELAEHKEKFRKYLNEEMITRMSDFKGWLDRQKEDILDNIEILNKSLEKINFSNNPITFIQLDCEEDYPPRVKNIRFRLNDWKPNIAEYQRTKNEQILEESFFKIKSLLDDLTADENMRKETLDVRNWLKFKAVERYRENPKGRPFRSYTGTAKLSGGEGAQLTYTILGSAIAYQFGIHNEGLNENSFRFICVDEAFSKQDDEKARFLMDLCKQLHLQLMVVSPAKAEEVAIVEPYIARVHFIYRKHKRESEILDMPLLQFQESRKTYLEKIIE